MSVVACYRPEDELTAYSLVAVLREKGIAAELRPFSNPVGVPWLEGDVWGEILVLEEDLAKAQEIIKLYLASMPEPESSIEDEVHEEEGSEEDQSDGD
jgi:hypothetical protein